MTTQTLIGWARACRKQGFHSNLGEIADVLEAQAREIERLTVERDVNKRMHVTYKIAEGTCWEAAPTVDEDGNLVT